MAFAAVASKRAPLALAVTGLLQKLLLAEASASGAAPSAAALRPACAFAARRLFSTGGGAPFRGEEEGGGDEDAASDRLRSRGYSLPNSPVVDDIFGEPGCTGRHLKLAAAAALDEAATRGCCGCWELTVDVDKVKLKVAMPGLGKEHIKVWADKDDLMVEAKGDRDTEFDEDEEDPARYRFRMQFTKDSLKMLKMDQIKAEMKNGRLKLTVPKIKFEEEHVFQVKINREEVSEEESAGLYGISRSPGFVVQ